MRQGPVDIDKRLRGLVTGRATGGMEVALVASAATVFMPGKALGVAIRQVGDLTFQPCFLWLVAL